MVFGVEEPAPQLLIVLPKRAETASIAKKFFFMVYVILIICRLMNDLLPSALDRSYRPSMVFGLRGQK